MQPIGGNNCHHPLGEEMQGREADNHMRANSGVRVLPRFLRKPVRAFRQITPKQLFTNKLFQAVLALGVMLPAAGFYVSNDAASQKYIAAAASTAGFQVKSFIVNGAENVEPEFLRIQLASQLRKNLFEFDVEVARKQVIQNSWVEKATVRKIYPDSVIIDIVERDAVALWKSGDKLYLIARDGTVIAEASQEHMVLPQMVGDGANRNAAEFLSVMQQFPMLVSRTDAYVRVADRRWNLVLDDGLKVLLPESGWQEALGELYELQSRREILERGMLQIDMRLSDRLVLRMKPEEAEAHKAAIRDVVKQAGHKI